MSWYQFALFRFIVYKYSKPLSLCRANTVTTRLIFLYERVCILDTATDLGNTKH